MEHVIRLGEAWSKWCGFHRSPIFWILDLLNTVYITLKSPTREIYVSPFVWGRCSAACVSVGVPQTFLYPIFGGHKVILIALWFFLDLCYQYKWSDVICLGRACAWVHSWCGLLLSMRMSLVLVKPAQSVVVCIDLAVFGLLRFWILYVLHWNDLLMECIHALACKDGTVQLGSAGAHSDCLQLVFRDDKMTFIPLFFFPGFKVFTWIFRYRWYEAKLCGCP